MYPHTLLKKSLLAVSFALLTLPAVTAADSVKLMSNISNAYDCYLAAQFSILMRAPSNDDIEACTRAIRMEKLSKSGLAKTYTNRGVLRKIMHRNSSALRDYYRARSLGGETPELNVNIGNIAYAEKRYEKALRYYDKALSMNMRNEFIAHVNRGLVNERLGDLDAAIEDYRAALVTNPELDLARERLELIQFGDARLPNHENSELLAAVAHF